MILFLSPHIQFPGAFESYIFKPVDIVIFSTVLFFTFTTNTFSIRRSKLFYAFAIYFFLALISLLWGIYFLSSHGLDTININYEERHYLNYAAKRLFSLLICFIGFYLIVDSRRILNKDLLRWWFYGLTFAVLMHSIVNILDLSESIKRAGVLREGNFAGSYYLLSFFLMLIADKFRYKFSRFGIVISALGIFLSQSTIAIIVFFLLTAIFVLLKKDRLKNKALLFSIFGIFVVIVLQKQGILIYEKLFSLDVNYLSASRYDRLSSILSGLRMFQNSPLFGVGIQGYSFSLPLFADDYIKQSLDWNTRRIPNNIYIEILAEQGLVGFFSFLFLLYQIMKLSFVGFLSKININALAFISILLSWLAFPTYSVTFHWIGFALIRRITVNNNIIENDLAIRA